MAAVLKWAVVNYLQEAVAPLNVLVTKVIGMWNRFVAMVM